jgi:hypothetical protein
MIISDSRDVDFHWVLLEIAIAAFLAMMLLLERESAIDDDRRWTLTATAAASWKGTIVVDENLTERECLERAVNERDGKCVLGRVY